MYGAQLYRNLTKFLNLITVLNLCSILSFVRGFEIRICNTVCMYSRGLNKSYEVVKTTVLS